MGVCETCPLDIEQQALADQAEALRPTDEHAATKVAEGTVQLKGCLQILAGRTECSGPTHNANGQRVCPLNDGAVRICNTLRQAGLFSAPGQLGLISQPRTPGSNGQVGHNTGQYL